MKCPKCNDREKVEGKAYCKQCYAEYVKERRTAKKAAESGTPVVVDPPVTYEPPPNPQPEISWVEKINAEHEEWKKGKCIFCFQPSKIYNRRYGPVELCVAHACT